MKKLTMLLVFVSSIVYGHDALDQSTKVEKVIGTIGQSDFMHAYSQHVQTKIDGAIHYLCHCGNEPASQIYQELGTEAQCAVGIPEHRYLPIKKLNPQSSVASLVGAMAESDAIYINEEKMDKTQYGSQRCMLYHESVHGKYHDSAVSGMIKLLGFVGGSMGTYAALKALNIVTLRTFLSGVVGIVASMTLARKYQRLMERRADLQGHYAIQCSVCIHEEIERRTKMYDEAQKTIDDVLKTLSCEMQEKIKSYLKNVEDGECAQGYLYRSDLEKIAQSFGDKKCAYHSEQQKQVVV